jgi:hypothetical protein
VSPRGDTAPGKTREPVNYWVRITIVPQILSANV